MQALHSHEQVSDLLKAAGAIQLACMATLRGEALPPLFILSMSSSNEKNYPLNPLVCDGLPIVTNTHPSCVAIRKKGSMDTGLWHQLCKDCYMPLYENRLAAESVRN
jgi:hypothetical protein